MSKHTKGPWEVYEDDEFDTLTITAAGRDGKVAIATIDIGFDEPFESEQRANARLLAAAPALLEALEGAQHRVRWLMQSFADCQPILDELKKWDAIVAAATGRD